MLDLLHFAGQAYCVLHYSLRFESLLQVWILALLENAMHIVSPICVSMLLRDAHFQLESNSIRPCCQRI